MKKISLQKWLPALMWPALMWSVLLLISTSANAADIQVRVDRNNIELNETFTLLFEASEDVDDDPDFSPLEKDFQVLNKSTSSNISIVNGQYTKNMRWNVSLMPTKIGTITIPSISFGSDKSPAYQITISPVKQSTSGSNEEFMSELDISTDSAYPQSQIVVTQRLLSSRNINGYEFSALQTSGVEVSTQALGEVKQFQTKRGNTPYLVLEQSFVMYPQTSGTLNIEPSIATARLALNNRSSFDPFRNNTKTIRRASGNKTITVKPVPDAFSGKHWLPANEVQLVEEFPEASSYKVGEPITRTISLLVDGQSSAQLPEFELKDIEGLKQYPDKPLLNDLPTGTGITGTQQIKVAIIPSHAGSFTLPAMSVPWWNTNSNTLEIAEIKARTFNVGDVPVKSTTSKTPTSTQPLVAPKSSETVAPTTTPTVAPTATQTESGSALLWQIISLLLLIGWLITLFILWQTKSQYKIKNKIPGTSTPSLKTIYSQLSKACTNNDAQQCKDTLLIWAQVIFNHAPVYSLGELSTRVDNELSSSISDLNNALYKNNAEGWQCNNLVELCKNFASQVASDEDTSDKNKLEDLYQ